MRRQGLESNPERERISAEDVEGEALATMVVNAASIAGLMITTEALVSEVKEEKESGGGGAPDMGGMGGMGGF